MTQEKKQEILNKIVGEHVSSYVFIAQVEEDTGTDTSTISAWDGGINMALGLTERMKIRLQGKIAKLEEGDYE